MKRYSVIAAGLVAGAAAIFFTGAIIGKQTAEPRQAGRKICTVTQILESLTDDKRINASITMRCPEQEKLVRVDLPNARKFFVEHGADCALKISIDGVYGYERISEREWTDCKPVIHG